MYRSFTDRIFGGVCGGLAVDFHTNAWLLRVIFLMSAILTKGVAVLIYLALWWVMPQVSLIFDRKRDVGRLLFVVGLIIIILAIWMNERGKWVTGPSEQSLFGPSLVFFMSVFFLLRQLRG